jgi:hypothetical protein
MMRYSTEAIYPPSSVRTVHAVGVLSRLLARFMFRSETCEGLPQRGNIILRRLLAVQRSARPGRSWPGRLEATGGTGFW